MKTFLDSKIFDDVVNSHREGRLDTPSFLRFLADQYEAAEAVMEQQEKLYVAIDVEESSLWCMAHYRTVVIGLMLAEEVRFEGF